MTTSELEAVDWQHGLFWASLDYGYHMPLYHLKDNWTKVVADTNGPKPEARYIHTLSHDAIHKIEQDCVTGKGHAIVKRGAPVNVYWNEYKTVIGASNGCETKFVRVEVTSRTYHGRPVTKAELEAEAKAASEYP